MADFLVNGESVHTDSDVSLLRFLREDLGLTSAKDGCSQGSCGACTVLVDGSAVRSCTVSTASLGGKSVLTLEGLPAQERVLFAYSFSHAGAVQCGFCTPGMIMSAKTLFNRVPDPTREEVRQALRANVCRCTGYKKIVDAVMLAARLIREGNPVPEYADGAALGERMLRVDAPGKATGEALYADDLRLPGLLFGSALRSAWPRARILSIDTSRAQNTPGVVCVLTAADIPGKRRIGHLKKDYDVMIPVGGITRFLGDAVALVAAETREALDEAKRRIRVEYEVLEPVLSLEEAMREGAPLVHEDTPGNLLSEVRISRGSADARIASSAHVVTRRYSTPRTEHAFLEPETALAAPAGEGVTVWSADQGICQTQRECAEALGLPLDKVRVIATAVGGAFGGKEDMSVQHHAALLAYKSGRPVKVSLSRDESILIHPKRHGMEIEMTTACDEKGRLTALKAVLLTDGGAYASLSGPVLQRACTHAAGPYHFGDIDITGRAYYSNNPPCGAFRGFGVPQSCFASECNLNLLAEQVGISPWEIRWLNAIRPGETLPNGQIADASTALIETLEAVKPYFDEDPDSGIACAMKNSGLGVGVPDTGRAKLTMRGGTVEIRSSAACMGQGLGTVLTQIVHEMTGFPPEKIIYCTPDTSDSPDAGNTTASRQTLFTGEAARRAAEELKKALEGSSPGELEGCEFSGEYTALTDPLGTEKPNPISHIAYSYATHLVQLDSDGCIRKVVAAHDVGRAVNPLSMEGQIEGGVTMSLGWALTERFPLKDGRPQVKFGTLGLLRSDQVPEILPILVHGNPQGPAFGAKGIGEIASIPTAAAVQLAYFRRDKVFRTRLPLEDTPYSRKERRPGSKDR